ncbi:hypothetical protein [Brevibacillus laterosporus]|uniref:hypothetical protein n=1 Tax=Brevibacillus laterosporus TaxID=1465 RepID=UPI003F62665F
MKKEEVNHVTYIDYKSAKLALFTYLEGWYNRKRIHGGLGYKNTTSSRRFAEKRILVLNFFVSKILTQIHTFIDILI